jgi:hypothetical protein
MQKLMSIPVKKECRVLEFSPKPMPMPMMTLDEFMRMTGSRRICDPDAPPAIPKPSQILSFKMPPDENNKGVSIDSA